MYKISTERGDLFDVNMMIAMQITVSGNAAEKELTAAFYDAAASFEILNCKVVIDDQGNAFYHPCASHNHSISFRDFDLSELIREQECIRFRIEDGEATLVKDLSPAVRGKLS